MDDDTRPGGESGATPADDAPTPMMAQYLEAKAAHPDVLLLYRMGDFYELFFDDALHAAPVLDIALTRRGRHRGQEVPMCGVPARSVEGYLEKLIRNGFRVAICDQVENADDAKKRGGKSLVRRRIVRLVTPGTLDHDSLLDARRNNFLAALAGRPNVGAVAWVDMSTGEFHVSDLGAQSPETILAALSPSEILVPEGVASSPALESAGGGATATPCRAIAPAAAARALADRFGPTDPNVVALSTAAAVACATILSYLQDTQVDRVPRLSSPRWVDVRGRMHVDAATRANLELTRASGSGATSLLRCVDATTTAAGARLLAARLGAPLMNPDDIGARLDGVAFFIAERDLRTGLRAEFKSLPDVGRALSRLSVGRGGPRDLKMIAVGLRVSGRTARRLVSVPRTPGDVAHAAADLRCESDATAALGERLASALVDDPPLLVRDGRFARSGFHEGLDEARRLQNEGRRTIAGLQERYVADTGIKSLKIKHNGVLGYHVDVPAQHADRLMAPPHRDSFIHRQTLASSVRFSTAALADLAGRISRAAETAAALEEEIFEDLRADVVAHAGLVEKRTQALAALDVATALAEVAVARDWTRPDVCDDARFVVEGGRHPVVERILAEKSDGPFVANDCMLDADDSAAARLLLLTGPNMAGKSTFLRQNALIAILAQTGSFVPARKAHVGVVDRVFSRVGAADDLARGLSTFMVEMTETATILTEAGPRSLVILDEVGRGTSTLDGLSIAWATIEHLHDRSRCRTLFATHYHELTDLADRLTGVRNVHMRACEHDGDLVFLHEIAAGASDRSYGLHVARLAGLPESVLHRARDVLRTLEKSRAARNAPAPPRDAAPAPRATDRLRDAVDAVNPDRLTPREALERLYALRDLRAAETSPSERSAS